LAISAVFSEGVAILFVHQSRKIYGCWKCTQYEKREKIVAFFSFFLPFFIPTHCDVNSQQQTAASRHIKPANVRTYVRTFRASSRLLAGLMGIGPCLLPAASAVCSSHRQQLLLLLLLPGPDASPAPAVAAVADTYARTVPEEKIRTVISSTTT
jgi:hypothetical protein